jgi:hypothetical protein
VYIAVAALMTVYVHPLAFLVMTSYMHYLMYIATYAQKTNVAHGLFKRNVLFYKSLALAQVSAGQGLGWRGFGGVRRV